MPYMPYIPHFPSVLNSFLIVNLRVPFTFLFFIVPTRCTCTAVEFTPTYMHVPPPPRKNKKTKQNNCALHHLTFPYGCSSCCYVEFLAETKVGSVVRQFTWKDMCWVRDSTYNQPQPAG